MQEMDLWDVSVVDDGALNDNRVLIVGGGKMGSAILDGLTNVFEPGRITVCEPDDMRRAQLHDHYPEVNMIAGLGQVEDHSYLAEDWIIIAVKPQIINEVLDDINRIGCQSIVISVAVGISIAQLQESLPLASVMRIMPNLPVMIGEGMVLLAAGDRATNEQIDSVADACFELGDVSFIEEADIDVCAAISGSGPAYFALVIDALERAGIDAGLSPSLARDLAVTTMMGTADMLDMTGEDPLELARAVQSPGGTTERAVAVLEERGLTSMFAAAINAAIERARELKEGA